MGISIGYSFTAPVTADTAAAVLEATDALGNDRAWLSCEPPFLNNDDGVLCGFSKPNFTPHPDDAPSAASEGLPDGALSDLLEILCELSRQFDVDWEISHDYTDGPVGFIRRGVVDDEVRTQCDAFSELAENLGLEGFDLEDL